MDETQKQHRTDNRTSEIRAQDATELAQRPRRRLYDTDFGGQRLQLEEDLKSPSSFCAPFSSTDYGVVDRFLCKTTKTQSTTQTDQWFDANVKPKTELFMTDYQTKRSGKFKRVAK